MRPRLQSSAYARPLNFTVRRHHAHIPLFPRWVLTLGRLPDIGPGILGQLPECYVRGNGRIHIVRLVISAFNLWVGVSKAGYTLGDELPIFLLIFAVPAAVAIILKWRFL